MTIWLACSDGFTIFGLTGIVSDPKGVPVTDEVISPDVREQLYEILKDWEYSHEPLPAATALLAEHGWRRDKEQDRDNGYVSGMAFTRP